jgi:hypothetical protein
MTESNTSKKSWHENLKKRWQLKSTWQVIMVLITFACTGFSVLFLKEPLYTLAGIDEQTPLWWRALFYCLTVLPAYQVILLIWGFLFGQFQFFWNFEKRLFGRFIGFFRR